jgi:mRNA interferase MazF
VIFLPFPYSDLTTQKIRPALLLADAGRGDWVLCQITSKPYADSYAIELTQTAFESGSLQHVSYVRPSKLFTANKLLFAGVAGRIKMEKYRLVVDEITRMLSLSCQ